MCEANSIEDAIHGINYSLSALERLIKEKYGNPKNPVESLNMQKELDELLSSISGKTELFKSLITMKKVEINNTFKGASIHQVNKEMYEMFPYCKRNCSNRALSLWSDCTDCEIYQSYLASGIIHTRKLIEKIEKSNQP